MSDTTQRAEEPASAARIEHRRVRWERVGIGAAVGLVLTTALGSAWIMFLGAGLGLGVMLAWELLACRRADGT